MKFVCERCHTKYSIADEKVRGKVLKVRCKTCTNVITVRETGATIDDPAGVAGPREAGIARSGSFDAGGAPTVANASAVAKAAARSNSGRVATLPADALFAPGAPAAMPPRKPTPAATPPQDDVEWYLAVDGAQTGPFPRSRLVDKILATPKEADVHVWNAGFGETWKPPKDVPEVESELGRRRRAGPGAPPPPSRGITGPQPLAAAAVETHGAGAGHAGAVGAGMVSLDSGAQSSKVGAKAPKKNGVGPASVSAAASAAVASGAAAADFGLGDLLGGDATPSPVSPATTAALAKGAGATAVSDAAATTLTPPPAAAAKAMAAAAGAHVGKAKPVKLLLGAAAVVAVVCGIVLFWMFRTPTTSVAALPPAAKPPGTDFAGLAEKLAQEEAAKTPVAPPVEVSPPVEPAKPITTRIEPPAKGKNKKGHKSTAPPPLSPTAPPPPSSSGSGSGSGLTAEQRAAAYRFGESTGREVRVPTSATGAAARSTPNQADISRVINNNRQGIQTCYQRALLRDNSLTHGKVTVRVSIGLSGRVKSVNLDAPAQFRALEPCIRDVMSRWAFPPSSEEYGTEFPVVLQGNN